VAERLDIDWLTESLAVGGCFPADAAILLARTHRIDCVVDVRAEACDDDIGLRRHGVSFLHVPTPDKCAIAPTAIQRAVAWIAGALDGGARVLVHCEYGIGRSALLALCVLVDRGHAPLDALTLLKDTRPVASPSPEQLRAFLAFAAARRRAAGTTWLVPSFDALAAIAYRHLATPGGPGAASAGG
jgi:protein-tyrosine phosphatase